MLDSERVVLYREDCRDIPYVFHQTNIEEVPPTAVFAQFAIEISKSGNKVFILAVKIPQNLIKSIVTGRKPVITIGRHPQAKMQILDLTEKQAKRLLSECESDFKSLVDLLQVRNGRIEIRDLDNLLKFGLVSGDKPHSPKSIPMKDVMRKNFQTINASIQKDSEGISHKLYRLN